MKLKNSSHPEAALFEEVYGIHKNPFSVSSADKYEIWDALQIYAPDPKRTIPAFSPDNSIIRGDYGTGKTMLLKAIDALYTSTLLVNFAERGYSPHLTVPVNFAEIADIQDPENLYLESVHLLVNSLIKKLDSIKKLINSKNWFVQFRKWHKSLKEAEIIVEDVRYDGLDPETVENLVKEVFGDRDRSGFNLLEAGNNLKRTWSAQQKNGNQRFKDLNEIINDNFSNYFSKIIFLCDEVGSLSFHYFEKLGSESSKFETFINQIRTSEFFSYKIATYPNSYADILQGARYGRITNLVYDVREKDDYNEYKNLLIKICQKYISTSLNSINNGSVANIFLTGPKEDAMEQIIYASEGIIRRFLILTDQCLRQFAQHLKANNKKININNLQLKNDLVQEIISNFGKTIFEIYNQEEREIIGRIAFFCQQAYTFRFRFKEASKILQSIFKKSGQDKIFKIDELEANEIGQIYTFDFTFALYSNIPTHVLQNKRGIAISRSIYDGRWIGKIVKIREGILHDDTIYSGLIKRLEEKFRFGFIGMEPNGEEIFFSFSNIVDSGPLSRLSELQQGAKVQFKIGKNHKGYCAVSIRIISDIDKENLNMLESHSYDISNISQKISQVDKLFSRNFGFDLFHKIQRFVEAITDFNLTEGTDEKDFDTLVKNLAQILNGIDTKLIKRKLPQDKNISGSINQLEEFCKLSKFKFDKQVFDSLRIIGIMRNAREHNDREEFIKNLEKIRCETMPIDWQKACGLAITSFLEGINGLIKTLERNKLPQ